MKALISRIFKNLVHPASIIGIVVALAIPFFIYWAPNHGLKEQIQYLESHLPLPLFVVQFIAIIVFAVLLRKDFWKWLKTILPEKKISILLLVFTAAISIFAFTQIEARHRVQSDESVFMSVAQNMYHNQESSTCNQGYFEDGKLNCVAKSNSFKTKGLSFLYAIGIPLFGTDLHWIFHFEYLLLPLAILLMFLAIVAWTKQPLLAFFATLLMALQPTVLFQFRSMSVEPLYIFLSALSLFVFKWAADKNTWKHWALLALILAFFAQTRQETVFCFAPFILFALPKLLDGKRAQMPVFAVLLSLFSVPILLTISAYQGFGFQGGEFEAHGHFLEDVKNNWDVMTRPLQKNGDLENPFLTYFNWLFAIGGVYLIIRAIVDPFLKKGSEKFFYLIVLAFVVLYHIQTYVILENVSGDFGIQINQRYSLVMIPTMAFLAALPIAHVVQLLTKTISKPKIFSWIAMAIAAIVAAGFTTWTFHYKDQFNKNIMYNRNHLTMEEHEIMNWLAEQPKTDKLFIYGRPWHFVGYGISSIHYNTASRMSNAELKNLLDRYKGEVYYIRGLDCWDSQTYHKKAVEHRIATTCDIFERDMEMEGVKNILITNNYWVQIGKFHGRKSYDNKKVIAIQSPTVKISQDSTAQQKKDSLAVAVDSLQIAYSMNETSEVTSQWELVTLVNNKIQKTSNYNQGSYVFSEPISSLLPGFNQFRFIVRDSPKKKKITDNVINYLNKTEGLMVLADLNFESHQQGWGNLHRNESIEGKKLTIDGVAYESGLGTHAPSTTVYPVNGQYSTFRSVVGLDDESVCSDGVIVEVFGDNNKLYETSVIRNGSASILNIPISGVQKLSIQSRPAGTKDCTHVDFVNAVLIP